MKSETVKLAEGVILESRKLKLSDLQLNTGQIPDVPKNPRFIRDEKFQKLLKSIEDDPEMLSVNELKVFPFDGKYVIIGGNMRYRALKELGKKEAVCKIIPATATAKQLRAYIQKDNVSFGEWDYDALANEWDEKELEDWGVDIPNLDMPDTETGNEDEGNKGVDDKYSSKIEIPVYPCTNSKPALSECFDSSKCDELIANIESNKNISEEEKKFLKIAAYRHCVINFEKVADYYAHSDKQLQELFEDNALVLIDLDRAIEKGFVILTEKMRESYCEDYGNEK